MRRISPKFRFRLLAQSPEAKKLIVTGWIAACVGSVGLVTKSKAQQLLPADRQEIADQERLSWTLQKFPPQPYMNEIYWQYSKDTPAFSPFPAPIRRPILLFDARQF